jgi:hypothetical protein
MPPRLVSGSVKTGSKLDNEYNNTNINTSPIFFVYNLAIECV